MKTRLLLCCGLLYLGGCMSFTAVPPGATQISGLTVVNENIWNQAPREASRLLRADSRTWTQNGLLLDRMIFIPAIADGEPIFNQTSQSQALPLFNAGMLPNEIEELTESSIVKLFGEGGATVETRRLRPHRFGTNKGIMFNLDVSVSDGPDYRGDVGAMIVDEKLYLVIYLAAEPYYYDRHRQEAVRIIESAHVDSRGPTSRLSVPELRTFGLAMVVDQGEG